jgi:hypothetical protein
MHEGVIGTSVEDRFRLALGKLDTTFSSRMFGRAARSAYDEAMRLSEMFPSVVAKPRFLTGPEAGSMPYRPSSSILGSLEWERQVVVELCVPMLHHNTDLYIYVSSESKILPELRCPMYMAVMDHRMSTYDQGNDALHAWGCKRVQKAANNILASSACLDDILDVCREWCAASVDIPA